MIVIWAAVDHRASPSQGGRSCPHSASCVEQGVQAPRCDRVVSVTSRWPGALRRCIEQAWEHCARDGYQLP